MGITPGSDLGKASRFPVHISLPLTLGFGDKHYFARRHFGFFSGGIALAVPLAFIPKQFGTWSLGASALYYRLGRTSAEFTNRGERDESVLSGTLSVELWPARRGAAESHLRDHRICEGERRQILPVT